MISENKILVQTSLLWSWRMKKRFAYPEIRPRGGKNVQAGRRMRASSCWRSLYTPVNSQGYLQLHQYLLVCLCLSLCGRTKRTAVCFVCLFVRASLNPDQPLSNFGVTILDNWRIVWSSNRATDSESPKLWSVGMLDSLRMLDSLQMVEKLRPIELHAEIAPKWGAIGWLLFCCS